MYLVSVSAQRELQQFYYRCIHSNGFSFLVRRTSQRIFDSCSRLVAVRTLPLITLQSQLKL